MTKVYWLNDIIFHTKPEYKESIKKSVEDLLKNFGNEENQNIILDPLKLLRKLFTKLDINRFDNILCLNNKYTPLLEKLFPDKIVITHFIARIRDVTKNNWPTIDFWKESKIKKLEGHVLIFDDVSFSGGTLSEVIKDFKLKNNQFEIALLVSIKKFKRKKLKIHSAFEIRDEIFDLWHLEDWINEISDNLLKFLKTNQTIESFLRKNKMREKQVNPFMWMNRSWVERFWQSDKLDEIKGEVNEISKIIKRFEILNPEYAPSSFYSNKI